MVLNSGSGGPPALQHFSVCSAPNTPDPSNMLINKPLAVCFGRKAQKCGDPPGPGLETTALLLKVTLTAS